MIDGAPPIYVAFRLFVLFSVMVYGMRYCCFCNGFFYVDDGGCVLLLLRIILLVLLPCYVSLVVGFVVVAFTLTLMFTMLIGTWYLVYAMYVCILAFVWELVRRCRA